MQLKLGGVSDYIHRAAVRAKCDVSITVLLDNAQVWYHCHLVSAERFCHLSK